MNKEKLKNIALILALVLLIVITYNVIGLKKQIDSYENDRSMLFNMHNDIRNIRNETDRAYDNIEELLKEEQSLFSKTSVEIKLKDSKLEITMSAIPKEISNDETLIAKITAGDKVYEQQADKSGTAVILVDIIDTIKPMFIIKSETGVRQEALPEQYTNQELTIDIYTDWNDVDRDDQWKLNLWILKTDKELPFNKSDIANAEFMLVKMDHPVEEEYELMIESNIDGLFADLDSISIPAEEITGGEGKLYIGYTADFSEYADKHEGLRYEIYFVLTTKDGMKYTSPYNSVASFSSDEGGSSKGCGSDMIRPIFE